MANSPYQNLGPITNTYGAPAGTSQTTPMNNIDYTNKVLNVLGKANIHPLTAAQRRPEIRLDPRYGQGITSPVDAAYSNWGASQPMYNTDNSYYTEPELENTFTPSQFGGTANVPWFSPAAGSGTQGSDYDTGVVYSTPEEAIEAGDYWSAYRKDHMHWRAGTGYWAGKGKQEGQSDLDYPGRKDLDIHSDSDQLEDMTGKSLLDYKTEYAIDNIKETYEEVKDYITDKAEPAMSIYDDAVEWTSEKVDAAQDWASDKLDAAEDWLESLWQAD